MLILCVYYASASVFLLILRIQLLRIITRLCCVCLLCVIFGCSWLSTAAADSSYTELSSVVYCLSSCEHDYASVSSYVFLLFLHLYRGSSAVVASLSVSAGVLSLSLLSYSSVASGVSS